jgi:hypothetical protein
MFAKNGPQAVASVHPFPCDLRAALFWILTGTLAWGFELRVAPPAEYDRYLAKRNVVLADGARAVEAERGIQILDKEFRPLAMIRMPDIRHFVSCRGTDLAVFTDASLSVFDREGAEKATFLRLKEPEPLLVRGDCVGFADSASFREGTTRISLLTDQYQVRSCFSVPGRFQVLDPARGHGVAWLARSHVAFEPELVSIWKDGAKVCSLGRAKVRQHLAVFPVADGGPIYLWEYEQGGALFLSAVDLEGKPLWRTDFTPSQIEAPKAVPSPSGDGLAAWGCVKGQARRGMSLWLLDAKGSVKAKREFSRIDELAFHPAGQHLLVAADGQLHSLRPADGGTMWRRRADFRIVSNPPFAFGGQGGKQYLAFLCLGSTPNATRGEAGTSAVEVRDLATGRTLGRKTLEGIDFCRIEKLSDERLLLRGDSRSWIAEVAY